MCVCVYTSTLILIEVTYNADCRSGEYPAYLPEYEGIIANHIFEVVIVPIHT